MKKLLVTLLLGAGFVTVALANESLVCDIGHPTNQCCIDSSTMKGAINHSIYHVHTTQDGHSLAFVDVDSVINDGIDGTWCIANGTYLDANLEPHIQVLVTWLPGDWLGTTTTYYDLSAK